MLQILVVGEPAHVTFIRQKLLVEANVTGVSSVAAVDPKALDAFDWVWDFAFTPTVMPYYFGINNAKVVANTALTSWLSLGVAYGLPKQLNHFLGANLLNGLYDRPLLECTLPPNTQNAILEEVSKLVDFKPTCVQDRVGMVTPRVLSMLINEACYTVMEKTATPDAIDLGMKLGTNYPKGPFEWLAAMGINTVYNLLNALYEDTKEERYKMSPLLVQAFQRQKIGLPMFEQA